MNVGDIKLETTTSAKTKATTTVEHIVTQEEVDAYNVQVAKADKDAIFTALKELDNVAPRYLEDFIAGDLTRIEEAIAKKLELRAKL